MSILNNIKIRRSFLIAIGVLIVSLIVFRKLSSMSKKTPVTSSFQTVNVLTGEVTNKDHRLNILLTGKLVAKNRIDLFSEVNGVLLSSNFREGIAYGAGSVVAKLDDSELRASIKAQKSILLNSISQILPDLALDYPQAFEIWKSFHKSISFDKPLPALPVINNDPLRLFISSKNILANYYNVAGLEERLAKYTITSPFPSVLISADINPGALVRAGQKLGSLIQPGSFELEASASLDDLKYIKIGDHVQMTSGDMSGSWPGQILRINRSMDPSTQMVRIYIGVAGQDLKEGQYLRANIRGVTLTDVFEISRQFLLEGNQMYFVENDSILRKRTVEVVYKGVETAFVRGLHPGAFFLNQALNSAYEGMIVKPIGMPTKGSK